MSLFLHYLEPLSYCFCDEHARTFASARCNLLFFEQRPPSLEGEGSPVR